MVTSQPPGHAGHGPDRPALLSRPGQPWVGQQRAGRPRPPGRAARARVAGSATGLAACVAAAVGVVVGATGRHEPGGHPPVTFAGVNLATHVHATAALTAASWGTSIRLTIRGVPLNVRCRLVVRSRTGAAETAGVWDAWREGSITVPASAGWRPSEIASLQVKVGARAAVTIKTAGAAPAKQSSARSRRLR